MFRCDLNISGGGGLPLVGPHQSINYTGIIEPTSPTATSTLQSGWGQADHTVPYHTIPAQYAGMVYRHFFGRFEKLPPLLSGQLPYRYAVGHSIAVKFTAHSAMYEIWSVDCQENY